MGQVRIPGERRLRTVRVWTGGDAPRPDDTVEEITDPFQAAHPLSGDHALGDGDPDAAELAWELPALPGGLRRPLGELELAPPIRPGKIVCIGRNYRAHAAEMGNEVPTEPLLFFKPGSALVGSGQPIELPSGYDRIDMEAELVLVIGREGRRIRAENAARHIAGYTLGNDVSCRDLQRRDKQWTRAKGFDTFAPLGPFVRIADPEAPLPRDARIQGFVDGERKQDAPLSDMVFDFGTVLAYISACMSLEPGDIIYTGTPEGVSPLVPGTRTRVELQGYPLGTLENPVVAAD